MPSHQKTTKLSAFKGLNNNINPESTPKEYLKKALNIDIDKLGGITKRKGYTKVDTAVYTSLWSNEISSVCLAVRNGDLVRIMPDLSYTTLRVGVGSNPLSFEEVDGIIYYTSSSITGILDNLSPKSWGIPMVIALPTLSSSTGTLEAGTYQVAYSYVRSDGIESGVGVASVITVAANSSIILSIPTNSDGTIISARIYCSNQNGNTLFYAGATTPGSTYTISSTTNLVNPLRLFNMDAAPTGSIVKYYNGRLYIASGNVLWYSEKYMYQHFILESNYIEFPDTIREIMPVDDGIWIGSDNIYTLQGHDPDKFSKHTKEIATVVQGTATKISGSYIHMDNVPTGYKWIVSTDLGIFILFNQGMIVNVTSQNVEMNPADSGTSLFLQTNGMNQYLSILRTNEQPNNSVLGDLVETSIVRNGITIT